MKLKVLEKMQGDRRKGKERKGKKTNTRKLYEFPKRARL
jgi:hypothetical protein